MVASYHCVPQSEKKDQSLLVIAHGLSTFRLILCYDNPKELLERWWKKQSLIPFESHIWHTLNNRKPR